MKNILTLLFFCTLTIVAKAQFYGDDNIHYYISSGESISSVSEIKMVVFLGNKMVETTQSKQETVRWLKQSSSYWYNELKKRNADYEYDSEYSTSKRTTYKTEWRGQGRATMTPGLAGPSFGWSKGSLLGYYYYAFSKDKSSLIIFRVSNTTSEVENKNYYTEIPLSELMPKGANKDFLYE